MQNDRFQSLAFFGTLFLIVATLSLAQAVLIPVALAVLLTLVLSPIVRFLQRRGLRRILAVVVVSGCAFVLLGILIYSIMAQFMTLADHAKKYEGILLTKIKSMQTGEESSFSKMLLSVKRVVRELGEVKEKKASPKEFELTVGVVTLSGGQGPSALLNATAFAISAGPITTKLQKETADEEEIAVPVRMQTDPLNVLAFYVSTVREGIRVIASAVLVVALVIVMLIYREELRDRFIRLTGCNRLTVTTKALDEASYRLSHYMLRKLIVNSAFGLIVSVVLFAIGVNFAVLWGVLLAILRFIPGSGVWFSALPPLLISLITFESWWPFSILFLVFIAGELCMMYVVEPRVVGPQIGLLPVATMVGLTFWTWLWGPVGLLLAIPLTVCLSVLGKYVPQLEYLNMLLSDTPAMDTALRYYQRLLASDADEAMEIVENYVETHDCQSVYDEIIVPSLGFLHRDIVAGEIPSRDQAFAFKTTQEILDNLQLMESESKSFQETPNNSAILVGCPVKTAGDELAVQMIRSSLNSRGYQFATIAVGKLSSEVLQWAITQEPDVICLATVGQGELTFTKFLAKRFRNHLPKAQILVARLGNNDGIPANNDLQSIGNIQICSTVFETTQKLIQLAHHTVFYDSPGENEAVTKES